MSGYLGSIGFGYPAALGAWAATQGAPVSRRPALAALQDRPVVCVTGDGGFGQYPWEVNTAVKHGMNITHVLLNNNELGKISKEQRAGAVGGLADHRSTNPNIAEYVTSCGGLGVRVREIDALSEAITSALRHDGPATVEVMTDASLV
jgi:pyruvate oxidase